jgi:hypothetical protein
MGRSALLSADRLSGSASVSPRLHIRVVEEVNGDADASSSGGFPPVWNTDAIRRSFPQQWAEYCKLTFKTAYGIQKAFPGLDSKTARAWIKGEHGPSGGFVAAVVKADPRALEILGRDA